MVCRSCGLGPSRPTIKRAKTVVTTNTSKPIKGTIPPHKSKTVIPTRSPAKTFTTVGDL